MGLALHPSMYGEWPTPTKPWIYLAYAYHYIASPGCAGGSGPCNFNTKIVRYDYDRVTHCDGNYNGLTLANQTVLSEQANCAALLSAASSVDVYEKKRNSKLESLPVNYLAQGWEIVQAASQRRRNSSGRYLNHPRNAQYGKIQGPLYILMD